MRLLHIHGRFDPPREALATASLIAALGADVVHTVVATEPITPQAQWRLASGATSVGFPDDFPRPAPTWRPETLRRIASSLRGHDLVLTHGWDALGAVLAHTVFRDLLDLPPLVHHEHRLAAEDGVGGRARARDWIRRLALGRAAALVVPGPALAAVAASRWQQPPSRVRTVAPLVDPALFSRTAAPDALPRLIKRPGDRWLGTVAAPAPGEALDRLLDLLAALAPEWQLVIGGAAHAADAIRAEALRRDVAHRVHSTGRVDDLPALLALLDVFVWTGPDAPDPALIAHAAAAALPVAALAVGDGAVALGADNAGGTGGVDTPRDLADLVELLAAERPLRRAWGEQNRRQARARSGGEALRAVYARALGIAAFP